MPQTSGVTIGRAARRDRAATAARLPALIARLADLAGTHGRPGGGPRGCSAAWPTRRPRCAKQAKKAARAPAGGSRISGHPRLWPARGARNRDRLGARRIGRLRVPSRRRDPARPPRHAAQGRLAQPGDPDARSQAPGAPDGEDRRSLPLDRRARSGSSACSVRAFSLRPTRHATRRTGSSWSSVYCGPNLQGSPSSAPSSWISVAGRRRISSSEFGADPRGARIPRARFYFAVRDHVDGVTLQSLIYAGSDVRRRQILRSFARSSAALESCTAPALTHGGSSRRTSSCCTTTASSWAIRLYRSLRWEPRPGSAVVRLPLRGPRDVPGELLGRSGRRSLRLGVRRPRTGLRPAAVRGR